MHEKRSHTLSTMDTAGNEYYYSVCRNGEECQGETIMANQLSEDGDICYVLGRWDASISPDYSSENGGTFSFMYENGIYI